MIDNQAAITSALVTAIRMVYPDAYISESEISSTPPVFPAIAIIQSDISTAQKYSTFSKVDNVAKEEYKIEIYSNQVNTGEAQTKAIAGIVDGVMASNFYIMSFNQPIVNADKAYARRVMRYQKLNGGN